MRKNRKMSESRRPSVSFTAMPPGVLVNDSRSNSTDDIQIALAPHIQTYLSQTGRRHSCCSVMLPVAFERASSKSWMDPKFDSPVLEGQFQTSVFPHCTGLDRDIADNFLAHQEQSNSQPGSHVDYSSSSTTVSETYGKQHSRSSSKGKWFAAVWLEVESSHSDGLCCTDLENR